MLEDQLKKEKLEQKKKTILKKLAELPLVDPTHVLRPIGEQYPTRTSKPIILGTLNKRIRIYR